MLFLPEDFSVFFIEPMSNVINSLEFSLWHFAFLSVFCLLLSYTQLDVNIMAEAQASDVFM